MIPAFRLVTYERLATVCVSNYFSPGSVARPMTEFTLDQTTSWAVSWTAQEPMARSCHALADDGRVWLVDPVDDPAALARASALGEPAGVLQLLDRHNRDGAAIAARLGVPHLAMPDAVPGSPFEVVRVVDVPRWHERALWWPERRALVVAEAIGTGRFYGAGGAAPAGIHLLLRLRPPGALRGFAPDHLLAGHGPPLHGVRAAEGVRSAYARTRRDIPRALAAIVRSG
jgi:hypothetical protein